jgi:hypothetical protein
MELYPALSVFIEGPLCLFASGIHLENHLTFWRNQMQHNRSIIMTALLLVAVIAAGCSPAAQPQIPTPDTAAIEQTVVAVKTEAAESVIMELTANAPLATPTSMPSPTETALPPTEEPTPLPPLPTATFVPVLPTATFIPLPTFTPTPAAYSCTIVSQSPASGASLKVREDFDLAVKLKNTGTKDWELQIADFFYVSGTKFQTRFDVIDLPEAVLPGKEITLIIDMLTPDTAGTYTAVWAVGEGSTRYCTINMSIKVTE